ncbi:MBOAT-domain-containing protein [Thozetella sp. PMI_491]|nr:MBOAT-domain-containing protein [Thozetella sp. PMI_491]
MGLFTFLRGVYDLDTLDTRFTTPSTVPYKTVIDARSDPDGRREELEKAAKNAQPSKGNTAEFYFYYLVVAVAVPYMFWTAYDVSRDTDPRYSKYEHLLSDGWIPGRKIDVSDAQYHAFRTNLPYIAALLLLHPLCRRLWNSNFPVSTKGSSSTIPSPENADARLKQRTSFDFVFALFFLVLLHGFSAFKVLSILWANYRLAKSLPRRYVPLATWIFNIGILFANELGQGYKFQRMTEFFAPGPWGDFEPGLPAIVKIGKWLDKMGGLNPRWEILFNITVLRLISFNLDYYWSMDKRGNVSVEKKQLDPANLSERDRVSIPAPPEDFTFRNYVAYAIYAPLYLTGPILTFNDYISQARYRPATIESPRTVRYGVRFLLVLLTMEVVLHFDYVGAISHAMPVWSSYTPAQLSMLSYFHLTIIWLKLLIPWRFFRLWALVDGVDAPENMIRCVSNNYSPVLFWRAWHRSYNRWLVRYMWIPLGGSDFRSPRTAVRSIGGYVLVFTFVALWHDIQMRLLIWGWLVVFFMLPEFTGKVLFPKRKWESSPTAYRMLSCAGGVFNILLLMMANLVGFAVGLDGLESILKGIFQDLSEKPLYNYRFQGISNSTDQSAELTAAPPVEGSRKE